MDGSHNGEHDSANPEPAAAGDAARENTQDQRDDCAHVRQDAVEVCESAPCTQHSNDEAASAQRGRIERWFLALVPARRCRYLVPMRRSAGPHPDG